MLSLSCTANTSRRGSSVKATVFHPDADTWRVAQKVISTWVWQITVRKTNTFYLLRVLCTCFTLLSKVKGSPYSITERRVLELIPVLGSQPAGDVSHKPEGRLPLLSTRPTVTFATLKRAATNFAAWWTEAQWVWTVCLKLLPDGVATVLWTWAFWAWVQHANHSATEPPTLLGVMTIHTDRRWVLVLPAEIMH